MAQDGTDAPAQMVAFRVGDQRFALPAHAIREVIRRPEVTRVPHAPDSILGLGNLRGAVLPLVSLAKLIGQPGGDGGRIMVLDRADPVGILVDEVSAAIARRDEETEDLRQIDIQSLLAEAFGSVQGGRRPSRAAAPAPRIAHPQEASAAIALLAFSAGGQEFALPLDQIEEVIRQPDTITPLPKADPVAVGSIGHRGRLLPLLSLRLLLGLGGDARGDRPRIVIARIGSHRVGLVVDAIHAVLRIDADMVDAIPAVLARNVAEARIQAICRLDDGKRLISILAADHLVRADLTAKILEQADGGAGDMAAEMADTDTEQFLVFRLGAQDFGIPIAVVIEVAMMPDKLTPLPRAPAFILGVMNLRGKVIPVVDQAQRFESGAPSARRRRVMIVSLGEMLVGFAVDTVSEVLDIDVAALRPAPELGSARSRVFDRVANIEGSGRMILIVEPQELIDRAERDLLAAVTKDGPAAS